MAQKLNDLKFIQGQGGSGRIANGTDFISALMFFNNTRPAAMGSDNFATGQVRQIFSPADAVALGIDDSYSDETKAAATFQVTAVGTDGDVDTIKVLEWTGGTGNGLLSIGVYTKVTADNTATKVATALAAAINAANTGPTPTGYSATSSTDTVTITARKKTGIFLNSGTPLTFTTVASGGGAGGLTATIVQFGQGGNTAGVASKLAVYYYHIQRYFAIKSDGTLYIGIFNTSTASSFSGLADIETFAQGAVVQCGVWDDTQTFALASLTLIQTQVTALKAAQKLLSSVVYAADIKALTTPLITLAGASFNLATLTAANVSACIDNDGNKNGYDLFKAVGKTISSLGACIGCVSEAAISEDIGNPIARFNADNGSEFDTLMFGDGTFYNTVSKSQLDALNNNRYIFLSKIPYTFGSFYSDDHTAIAYTSDFAYIHDNRIIDRVIKDSFVTLTPALKSKLKLQTDGTMTPQTIAHLVQLEGTVIAALIASEDLAGDPQNFDASKWIIINPLQQPNVAGKLIIAIKLVENAIAHSIEVPIGFVKNL